MLPTDQRYDAWMSSWQAVVLASREIEGVMRSTAGLSLTWGEVLARLDATTDGRLPMNVLARDVFVSRSAISQVVTAMGKRGLVERQHDDTDLRTTYAAITESGRTLLHESADTFLAAISDSFGRHLTDREAKVIAEALGRVTAVLRDQPGQRTG